MAAEQNVVIPIVGNLLSLVPELGITHIVHQVDCVSLYTKGLAIQWPWADVYSTRAPMTRRKNVATVATQATPGTIDVRRPTGDHLPVVVALNAQWDNGPPSSKRYGRPEAPRALCCVKEGDSARNRVVWFEQALDELGRHLESSDLPVVAFPYKIGCGLSHGNWDVYKQKINQWSLKYGIKTYIVALPSGRPAPKRKRTKDTLDVKTTKRAKGLKPKE